MNGKSGIRAPSKKSVPESVRKLPSKDEGDPTLSRSSSVSTLGSVLEGSESHDFPKASDFAVGERIWVNGTKPGYIGFLGETQFSLGVWAGVKLDEAEGKNDGSVNGVRYFECEPAKGIFIRPHRLTKEAGSPPGVSGDPSSPPGKKSGFTRQPLYTSPQNAKLKSGDRVVVNSSNGIKSGILRYIGSADFAAGEWAGVELDEPVGKNDGSVGGRKYFECPMKHGLFAPMHKVSKPGARSGLQNRSLSRESLNSTCSSVASSRVSRVKLGITSLNNAQKPPKGAGSAISPTQAALQDALKEKVEYIAQLLKERDSEKSELIRISSDAQQVRQAHNKLQDEHNAYSQQIEAKSLHLQVELKKAELDAKHNSNLLEEEKRKMEDLLFRYEEENILKAELEAQAERAAQKIQELEKLLQADDKKEVFTKQLASMDDILKGKDDQIARLEDDILDIRNQYSLKEAEISQLSLKLGASAKEIESLKEEGQEVKLLLEKLNSVEEKFKLLEKDRNDALTEATRMREAEKEMQQSLLIKDDEMNSLQKSLQQKTDEILQLTNSLEAGKVKITEQSESTSVAEKTLKDSEKKVSDLASEIGKLKSEISFRENIEQEMRNKLELSHQETVGKDNQVVELRQTLRVLEKKCECEMTLCQELQNKIALLEAKLSENNEADSNEVSAFREQVKDLTAKLTEKENSNNNLQSKITGLSNELNNKNNHICELTQQFEGLQKEVIILNQGNAESSTSLANQITELRQTFEIERKECEAKFEQAAVDKEAASKLLQEKDALLTQNAAYVESLKSELAQKETEILNLSTDLTGVSHKIQGMEQIIKDFQEHAVYDKSEKEKFLQNQEMEMTRLRAEVSEYASVIEKTKKEMLEKQSFIDELSNQVTSKESQIDELAGMAEKSQQQLELLKQQNAQNVSLLETQVAQFKVDQDKRFQEKDQVLLAEIETLNQQLTNKDNVIQSNQHQRQQDLASLADKEKFIGELKQRLGALEEKQSEGNTKESGLVSEYEAKVKSLMAQCEKLEKDNNEMAQKHQSVQKAHQELAKTKDSLLQDKMEQQAIVKDRESKLATVQQEVERMRRDFLLHKDDLQQKLDISHMELEAMKELKTELETQHGVLEELQEQLHVTETAKTELEQKLAEKTKAADQEQIKLKESISQLQQEIAKLTHREGGTSLNSYPSSFANFSSSFRKHSDDSELQSQQSIKKTEELKVSEETASKIKTLEKDNMILAVEVSKLKEALEKNLTNNSVDVKESADDEKETLRSQVDFLNSIIVDLQNKNEELKTKHDVPTEEVDINFNGKRQLPPRLYCDICEVFDMHDTEDCPTQSNLEEEVPHSRHHGKRNEERPYCNHCGVFGHWTLECDDQETF